LATVQALRRPNPVPRPLNRWVQVVGSVVGMMALSALVFVWPLLRAEPGQGLAESLVAAENAFAAFIIAETLFVPLEAWLGDRAPRGLLGGAGLALVAVGTLAGARAANPHAQVAWCALGGVGAGLAYGATVAKALRRFTDRKALCAGVTAAACAAVLGLGLVAVWVLTTAAELPVLVVLGAAQAVVIVVATLFILYPAAGPPPPEW
jgi:OFA family oxalate/formate antiporter-like MFS transporter